jgi:hypothetical protein
MKLRSAFPRGRSGPRFSCCLIAARSVAALFGGEVPIAEAAKVAGTGDWQRLKATASTVAEFRALADYCEQKTLRVSPQKKEHTVMLELVRRYPVTYGRLPKGPTRKVTLRHFLEEDQTAEEK